VKFSPSSTFVSLINGASKVIQWNIYIKTTGSLSEALTVGNWIDVTDRIYFDDLPEISSRLEYELGQFIADNISITAHDIHWWKDNVFTSSSITSQGVYIELKIEARLGIGQNSFASDVAYMFSGFIDKVGVEFNELEDSVIFQAFTAEDIGSRIAAENISTQFINTNVDGAGHSAIVLLKIPGLFVKNAAVNPSKPLKVGVHTIAYQLSGANKQVKLDGSQVWLTLAAGNNTIGDVDNTTTNDTQQIQLYVKSLSDLPATGTYSDTVIGINAGDVLPRQWYRSVQAQFILQQLYSICGITNSSFDAMSLESWDDKFNAYYYDTPPNDPTVTSRKMALCASGSDLLVAIGAVIYKRTMSSGVYTKIATCPYVNVSFQTITRIWYSARVDITWVAYTGDRFAFFRGAANLALPNSWSNEQIMSTGGTGIGVCAMEMVDVQYTAGSWKTGLIWANNFDGLLEFTDTSEANVTIISWANIQSDFLYQLGTAGIWRYKVSNGSGSYDLYSVSLNTSGAWVDNGFVGTGHGYFSWGGYYSLATGRIYYSSGSNVYSTSGIVGADLILHLVSTNNTTDFVANAAGDIFFTIDPGGAGSYNGKVYRIQGREQAELVATGACTQYKGLVCTDKVYGLNNPTGSPTGGFFQCDQTFPFIINTADFSGMNVRDAIKKVLKAFNLIGTVSTTKRVFVYRRGNSNGIPQTTGNILSLGISNVGSISETLYSYQSFQYIRVASESKTTTFDGSSFNSSVLSDRNVLDVNNSFIPDILAPHISYYLYQFFKVARTLYKAECRIFPAFQFEPFDGVNLTSNPALKIQKAITGSNTPIYAISCNRNGTITVEFLTDIELVTLDKWMPRIEFQPPKKKQLAHRVPVVVQGKPNGF
jgi:hypothetical protein